MIKAILFDAGGVVVSAYSVSSLLQNVSIPDKQKFEQEFNKCVDKLSLGKITLDKFKGKLLKFKNIPPEIYDEQYWQRDYEEKTHRQEDIIDLIKILRKKYQTIMISNTCEPHFKVNQKRGAFNLFDDVYLSHLTHLSKDENKIFKLVLEKRNLKGEECVFIDDVEKYVNVAKSAGINGIVFTSLPQLINDLKKYDIEM